MSTRMGDPSPKRDRGAVATEYGLMVTLISVLIGGLVAAFGAHLFPSPCSLFPTICAPDPTPTPEPPTPGPGPGPAPSPTDSPSVSTTDSTTSSATSTSTDSATESPSGSPSATPCPSPSTSGSLPDACSSPTSTAAS